MKGKEEYNDQLTPYEPKLMAKQDVGLYPHEWDKYGRIVEWSATPHPCTCCGGPIAVHRNDVWGVVCAICDALEESSDYSDYWIELECDPEIAHVDGSDREDTEEESA